MDLPSYRELLRLTLTIGVAAGGCALLASLIGFLRPVPAGGEGAKPTAARPLSWLAFLLVCLGLLVNTLASIARSIEVQHFPAQTMYEVLPFGVLTGFLSLVILYFVLGLHRLTGRMRALSDLFVGLVVFMLVLSLAYALKIDPTGRALPPALQSYWFMPHIAAYTFSYFTLGIAYTAAMLYIGFRFWLGILCADRFPASRRTLWAIAAFALLTPLANVYFNGPVFLLAGLLVGMLRLMGRTKFAWFAEWRDGIDTFTWRIFLVGFPFLTAGIIQGALWAQESWAIYWGWDSKEVSALISWLFYAIYLHLRFVAGWRGEKGLWILLLGGVSVFITFQLFGYLPASQSSLHRYTDPGILPLEGIGG